LKINLTAKCLIFDAYTPPDKHFKPVQHRFSTFLTEMFFSREKREKHQKELTQADIFVG
jgi:hypothetical protein